MDNNQIDDKNSKDTILIIEDDEAIIEILKIFFKENKFEVFTAFNGKQGLDLISRGDISLILCDIMMPVMDGYETLQNIRLLYNQLEMPIIMMTAKSKEEDIVKAFELGANDYITKPFNFRVLYSRVKTHLTLKNINDKFIKQNEQLKNLTTRLEKVLDNAINFVGFTQSLNYLNKKKLFDNIKKYLPVMFNAEYFSLFIYNKKQNQLELAVHNHKEWETKEEEFIVKEEKGGLMWDTVKAKKMMRIANFSQSKYSKKKSENESKKKYSENTVCMPLIIDDDIIGILNLNNFQDENMTSEHFANIRMVTNHLAMALNNLLLHNRIEEQAIKDELTGLFNRRYLFTILNNCIEEAKRYENPLSILMFDIDFFKKINDTYGHDNGDITLKNTAQTIKQILRKSDILCRFGGEEFIAILTHTTASNAIAIAERIRAEISKNQIILTNNSEITITLSIGISSFTKTDNSESIIKRADDALYEAKKTGRNRCVFFDAL